ncbi:MAG: prepilin peptidase [Pseudomonadota bacterium]
MTALILFLACVFIALGTGALAAWSDFKGMIIPNLYNGIILGAFLICYGGLYALGVHETVFAAPLNHAMSAGIVFLVTMIMFAAKALGAADSKMGTAIAAWAGVKGIFPFLFYMALIGGLLAAFALLIRGKKIFKNVPKDSWIDQVQSGKSKVPYGIALFVGMLGAFIQLGYLDPQLWVSLLN